MAPQRQVEGTVTIHNARVVFRNFAGAEGKYNAAGDRNFAVILDPEIARQMLQDGWNVKYLKPREEDIEAGAEVGDPYISVSVAFKNRPPKITMIGATSKSRTMLSEDLVEHLDWVDIDTCDVIIRPYNWEVRGERGVKAYLQTMYITIVEDELDLKYAEEPAE